MMNGHKGVVYLHSWPTLALSPCNSNPLHCTQIGHIKTILSTSSKIYRDQKCKMKGLEVNQRYQSSCWEGLVGFGG